MRRRNPFQLHKEDLVARQKKEEEEAAFVFANFVQSFDAQPEATRRAVDAPSGSERKHVKAFVKGGTIVPGLEGVRAAAAESADADLDGEPLVAADGIDGVPVKLSATSVRIAPLSIAVLSGARRPGASTARISSGLPTPSAPSAPAERGSGKGEPGCVAAAGAHADAGIGPTGKKRCAGAMAFLAELKQEQERRDMRDQHGGSGDGGDGGGGVSELDHDERRRGAARGGALSGGASARDGGGGTGSIRPYLDSSDPSSTNLYVGNLAPAVTEEVLYSHFGPFGQILSIKVMWPRTEEERRRARNCGFVAYATREDAAEAMDAMNGVVISDSELRIGWGKPAGTRELSESERDAFETMLRSLTVSRASVRALMVFCLESAAASVEVVETLAESLTLAQTPPPKKVARLMLLSDLLHNSSVASVRNASSYRQLLQRVLPQIFASLHETLEGIDSRMGREVLREQVSRVLRAWQAWAVYPTPFLESLEHTFSHGQTEPQARRADEADAGLPGPAQTAAVPGSGGEPELDGMPLDGAGAGARAGADDDLDGEPLGQGAEGEGAPCASKAELQRLALRELVALCESKRISSGGSRAEMADRLFRHAARKARKAEELVAVASGSGGKAADDDLPM